MSPLILFYGEGDISVRFIRHEAFILHFQEVTFYSSFLPSQYMEKNFFTPLSFIIAHCSVTDVNLSKLGSIANE